jgi:hypothetical protein
VVFLFFLVINLAIPLDLVIRSNGFSLQIIFFIILV